MAVDVDLGPEVAVIAILGFDWVRPGHWPWLLSVLGFLAFGLLAYGSRVRARSALADERHWHRLFPRFSRNRAVTRVGLAAAAAGLLLTSFLGPVRGYTWVDVERKGLDLVLCVDTSRSMLVQDMGGGQSRLDRAKLEIRLLLEKLKGDRVAIVGFSGDARDESPLTRDLGAVRHFLNQLSPYDNKVGGTNLGLALEHGLSLFDGRTGSHEAIVLVTDGEDLEQRGLEVAREAKNRGIKVFVIGMGSPDGGKIPVSGTSTFVRDRDGHEVIPKLDSATLEDIAKVTGGAYVSGTTPLALEKMYDRYIAAMEGRSYDSGREEIPHDRYQWPLFLAILCMFAEVVLSERRPRSRREYEV